MPTVYPQPPMYPPAQMPAGPPSWSYAEPPSPGPAQVVKGTEWSSHTHQLPRQASLATAVVCLGTSRLQCFFFFLAGWEKAYMPIDANHISNPKDS